MGLATLPSTKWPVQSDWPLYYQWNGQSLRTGHFPIQKSGQSHGTGHFWKGLALFFMLKVASPVASPMFKLYGNMFNASLLEREIKNFAAFRIFRWNNGTETEKSKLSKDKSRMNGDVRNQFIFYRNVKICLLLLTIWHNRKNTNLCMQSFSKKILD